MLLALDVGNTSITVGLYRGETLSGSWQLSSRRDRTADEYGPLIRGLLHDSELAGGTLEGMVISCVVPPAAAPVQEMARRYFDVEPLMIEPGVRTGLAIRTDNPQEVGADRIVNAVAAFARHGGPAVVVDFGTATTFDAIDSDGAYLGGAIAPGIGVAAEALFHRAAKLPRVEIRPPRNVIGRNTVMSIRSGLVYGYAALIDGLVLRMAVELAPGKEETVKVIGTGGYAEIMAGECQSLQTVEADLTLDGLRRIWERNRSDAVR